MGSLNVAYILLHFPYLTETFVAEEIHAIHSQGIDVQIVSLLEPGPGPVQPLSEELLPFVWYAPGVVSYELWIANLYFLIKSPRIYWGLLVRLLRQPYPRKPWMILAKRLLIFLKAIAAAYYLKEGDAHLLHTHFAWLSGAAAWICSCLTGLRYTVTVHAYDIYVSNDLLSLVSKEASRIVAISKYNSQQVELRTGCRSDAISVIHCGVDLSTIPQRQFVHAVQPIDKPMRILSVGSLTAKKGHRHLIDACALLKQRGFEFICNIIGNGEEEQALRQQVEMVDLGERVKLLGSRLHPEILEAYYQHDIFVLASEVTPSGDRDGIPVVLMEAGAAGLPLISTQISGIPELVRHGQTGWLVPTSDPISLADAITTLAADSALRVSLGQNARALVEAEFNIERNALRLANLFQDTIMNGKLSTLEIYSG